jgi:hypothetical protein
VEITSAYDTREDFRRSTHAHLSPLPAKAVGHLGTALYATQADLVAVALGVSFAIGVKPERLRGILCLVLGTPPPGEAFVYAHRNRKDHGSFHAPSCVFPLRRAGDAPERAMCRFFYIPRDRF